MLRKQVWMGALSILILGLTGGCPEKKTAAGAGEAPAEAPAAAEAAPAGPPFVAAPFPADDASLVPGAWRPIAPSDALAGLNLSPGGAGQLIQKLTGQPFPITKVGRWEAAGEGLRVTVTSGQITEIIQLVYGTVAGVPHLRWDGVTQVFTGAEGKRREQKTSPVAVLLRLPGWKAPTKEE